MKQFFIILFFVLTFFASPGDGLAGEEQGESVLLDILLVLDNSGSMKTNDPRFLTREVVTDFVQNLENGSRLGAVIFARNARLAVPLSMIDTPQTRETFLEALKLVDYSGKFTDSPAAIEKGLYELKTNGRKEAKKVLIFLTDGIVDTGDKARDLEKTKWLKEDLAQESKNLNIRIFGIAFTEDADFHLIQSLAVQTGGEYFRALKVEDIQGVFDTIHEKISQPVASTVEEVAQPRITATQPPGQPTVAMQAESPGSNQTPSNEKPVDPAKQLPLPLVIAGAGGLLLVVMLLFMGYRNRKKTPPAGPIRPSSAPHGHTDIQLPEACLIDTRKEFFKAPITLKKKLSKIGRTVGNDVRISEDTISGEHALVEFDAGSFFLEDIGSSNGTLLNGRKIEAYRKYRLKNGARITFDTFEFTFSLPGQAQADDGGKTVIRRGDPSSQRNVEKQSDKDNSRQEDAPAEEPAKGTRIKPGMCPNHQTLRATEMCEVCKGAFCKSCVSENDGKTICTNCARENQ